MTRMFRKRRGLSDRKSSVALVVATLAIIVIGMWSANVASGQLRTIRADQGQIQTLVNHLRDLNSSSATPEAGVGYTLTLVVANDQDQDFNSTLGPMPRYFVLGPNGLESSAIITVPANTLVKLVIVNYDDGGTNVTAPLATVSGTVDNSMLVFNGSADTSTSNKVNSIPTNGTLAHTFSVPSLGLNIPVPSSSVVVAYVRFGSAGTYTWDCFSPCMPWDNMSTQKAWMTGTFKVI